MKSQIRHHAEEIIRLLDEEKPIEEPEPPVENTDVWTIEQHPNSKSLDGNTYPAGTTINFLFMVLKNGKGAVADVIVSLPNGDIEMKSNPNGSLGISQVRVPENGMVLKATLKGFSDQSASYRINTTGTAPKPKDPEPEPEQPTGERPKPIQKQYAPFQATGAYQVLVHFGEKNHEWIGRWGANAVDVKINGKWYNFLNRQQNDPIWDVKNIGGTRGKIVYLNEPARSVELDPAQIIKEGADNHGFGYFGMKVGASPDVNLKALNGNSIFEWHDGMAIQVQRHATNGNTSRPDSNFYSQQIPTSWNVTKKFKILISRWEGQ